MPDTQVLLLLLRQTKTGTRPILNAEILRLIDFGQEILRELTLGSNSEVGHSTTIKSDTRTQTNYQDISLKPTERVDGSS